ncbi:MAG: hypothetical protein E6G68_05855 [Actinobacteria bacterium]|nr:MAG: hypothetical protein E6G68_05855 [Actinomycetota bacterium]
MNLVVAFIEDRRLGLAAIGALVIVAGSVLPWIQVAHPLGVATGYGLQDDGKITLLLGAGALGLIVAHARLRQRDLALAAGLFGLGAAAFAGAFVADLHPHAALVIARLLAGDQSPIDPGQVGTFAGRAAAGIYVVFAGAALLVVSAVGLMLRARGTTEPAPRSSS